MKTPLLLILVLLGSARLLAATAPDSIAGKVYRSNSYLTHNRYETTIIFGTDSRFIFLKDAWGQRIISAGLAKVAVQAPRPDGTYRYERVNDTDGEVSLSFDDGTVGGLSLTFTSPTGGGRIGVPLSSFFFTELSAAQVAPARNISMRGRVAPGQPLIVGLIVAGAAPAPQVEVVSPFGEKSQEVVIRVVGSSLRAFGISNGWADPDFQIYRGSALAELDEGHNPDWEGGVGESLSLDSGKGLTKIFSYLGAFQLAAGSKDAVDVLRLKPGVYTVVCNPPANDPGGEVLIEIYFLP
jgi:hypothetical protein